MKKIFFCSMPMLDADGLKQITYLKDGAKEIVSRPTRFPSIVMLDWSILGNEDVKIVMVKTDDDNDRTQHNIKLFEEELAALSADLEIELKIDAVVTLPHEENREKQISLFKEIASHFEEGADVYMDVTYGTKITSIGMFSSLVYAEKVKKCNVKSVIYGKYSHNGGEIGSIYDVRSMYEIAMLINSVDHLPSTDIDSLISALWG